MDNKTKKLAITDVLNGDDDNKYKYYVYALCEKKADGTMIPFYIGKGEGERVWAHEEGKEKEIARIKAEYKDEEEQINRIEELSKKYRRIHEIQNSSDSQVEKVIIKWGMTSKEAFMAESALINIFRFHGLKFDINKTPLTNKDNGHHSKGEDNASCYTMARTIDEFYTDCVQPPVDFDELANVVMICINKGYPDCLEIESSKRSDAVKEMVRGFWKLRDDAPDIIFAMYRQKVVGVYRIKKQFVEIHKKRSTKKKSVLYTILDVNRPDYPKSDVLPIRKSDYEFAKKIYDDLEKNDEGRVINACYDALSDELKAAVQEYFNELDKNICIKKYENWIKRKYYVLEDIKDTDPDAEYKKYLGSRIIRHTKDKDGNDVITSPIPARNYIKYSEK